MERFGAAEFRAFLRAVDGHLAKPFRLDIIGEAAAVLAFRAASGTTDIDVDGDIRPLQDALKRARLETGLDIPVSSAGIREAPWLYEDRVRRLRIAGLRNLQVFVPEKHDWALMKIARLLEKDIEDILEVAEKVGLSGKILLKRFLGEMTHVIGRKQDLIRSFLTMMGELYGDAEADRMEAIIWKHANWR